MSDELKRCPHCGGKAYIREHYTFGGYVPKDYPNNEPLGYAIGCGKYDCRGKRENTGFLYDTEAEAIAAWNARADDAPEQPVDKARDTINALRAYYGAGKTTMTDEQIQAGMEHYRPKREYDFAVVDELSEYPNTDNAQADSREQLEADIMATDYPFVHTPMGFRDIRSWLDRQAAITKRETLHDNPACLGSSTCAANRPISESADRETPDTAGIGASKDEIRDFDVWNVAYEIYCAGGYVYNGNEPNPPTDGIRKLLDRQAAITRREFDGECEFCQSEVARLQGKVDSLTAERDELNVKLKEAEEDVRDLDLEGHVLGDKLAAAEDMLHVVMKGGEPNYDEWMWQHDGLSDWFRESFTKTVPELTDERDEFADELKLDAIALDELRKQVDELTTERDLWNKRARQAHEHALGLTAERDAARDYAAYKVAECERQQRVIDTQRDSFLKLERENRELQDVCGELERTLENLRGD